MILIRYLVFLLASPIVIAQKYDVEVSIHKTEDTLTFYAVNHSNVRQEITLTITAQNLMGYKEPVTKFVGAKDSIFMIDLSFRKDQTWSYETNYTYTPKPTAKELEQQQIQLKQELFNFLDTKNNPIIVFYKEGCAASAYAKQMLEKKHVPFKYIEADKNDHYNKIMFELIRLQNPEVERIAYPVFLIDGKLDHTIENLRWYIKELAQK